MKIYILFLLVLGLLCSNEQVVGMKRKRSLTPDEEEKGLPLKKRKIALSSSSSETLSEGTASDQETKEKRPLRSKKSRSRKLPKITLRVPKKKKKVVKKKRSDEYQPESDDGESSEEDEYENLVEENTPENDEEVVWFGEDEDFQDDEEKHGSHKKKRKKKGESLYDQYKGDDGVYTCPDCGHYTKSKRSFKSHISRERHGHLKKIESRTRAQKHVKKSGHNAGRRGPRGGSKYDVYKRLDGTYLCPDCPCAFSELSKFYSHVHHEGHAGRKGKTRYEKYKKSDGSYRCPRCDHTNNNLFSFQNHLKETGHEKKVSLKDKFEKFKVNSGSGRYKCPDCGCFRINSKSLIEHARDMGHAGCKERGKEKKGSNNRLKYGKYKQADGKYYCPDCPHSFDNYALFTKHIYAKEHAGYKKQKGARKKRKELGAIETNTGMLIRKTETCSWPPIPVFLSVLGSDSGVVFQKMKLHAIGFNQPRAIRREIDVCCRILPCLKKNHKNMALQHALFQGVFLLEDKKNLVKDRGAFIARLESAFDMFCIGNPKEIIMDDDTLKLLRDGFGGIADNVSIIDDLSKVELAFKAAEQDRYEIPVDRYDTISIASDLQRIKNDKIPRSLRFVERVSNWRYSPELLQNIRRFRRNGTAQIIIVRVAKDHWITLKLYRERKKDRLIIADPLYSGDQQEAKVVLPSVLRAYYLFRTDPIPTPNYILPPMN